ncbi:Hypp2106 [Branchiostoma lanceolatum]|uniref:Hypp2106 protein n=1 Tax=Branchiostoma lanceolatum TaxID=7740 RepID=A0A8J9ZNX7_BRALA|nr:Hypp2106 [Branchiostoma lanceolatum]
MSTRATRGSTRKRDEPAGHMEGKHGDDLDDVTGASEFEAFVREQFKKLLEGQKELQDEVRALEDNVEKNVQLLEARMERMEKKMEASETTQRESAKQIKSITQRLKATEQAVEEFQTKCNKLERFSRRNNVRIIGRKVQKGENCVSTVEKILEDKFGLDHIKIERAHPDGPRNSDSDGVPQHILFKLNSYADKVSIMKATRRKLQDESYYFTDDLTVTDLQEKRKWMEKVRHAYKEGKKYRFYNGYWRDGQGKVVSFD